MFEQHVGGLDVPVQHAELVAAVQGGEHLEADVGGLTGRQGAVLAYHVGQRAAVDEFHHDPRPAVLFEHVVDGDDARVLDPGGGPGLALHPGLEDLQVLLREVADRQLLDGHLPVQHFVHGPPDGPHPAASQTLAERVPPRQ